MQTVKSSAAPPQPPTRLGTIIRRDPRLTVGDLVRDDWILGLTCNRAGRVAGSGEEAVCTYGAYVAWLDERLDGDRLLRAVLRELETYNPTERGVSIWRRAEREHAEKIVQGLAPWPVNLRPYKSIRELQFYHSDGDQPPWRDQGEKRRRLPSPAERLASVRASRKLAVRRKRGAQ